MSNPVLQLLFSDKAIFVFVNTINNDPEIQKLSPATRTRLYCAMNRNALLLHVVYENHSFIFLSL